MKSSNCLIDSRWTLKLTDFGLPKIYSNQNNKRNLKSSDLLWTAPEHLRNFEYGSQAGDIYSFGIIMQEIIVEGLPYCMMKLTHDEIIEKIRLRPDKSFRPILKELSAPIEYVKIMIDCWNEKAELRPTITYVHSKLLTLNRNR